MGHIPRRAGGCFGVGQSVLLPQTDRRERRRAVYGQGARGDPARGRRAGGQQLHQVLPGDAGPDTLARFPRRARRVDVAAEVVLLQYLRHFRLVEDICRALDDNLGAQARCESRPRYANRRAYDRRRARAHPRAANRSAFHLAQFLPRRRRMYQAGRASPFSAIPRGRRSIGPKVDARSLRAKRRPGGDLPTHSLLPDCDEVSGIPGRSPRADSGAGGASQARNRR